VRGRANGRARGLAATLVAILAAGVPAVGAAQARRADPPVRQPTLIRPIPPSELQPAPALRSAPAAATSRPGDPGADQDRYYDASAPGYARLQKAHEALAGFPVDRGGFVDWVAALAAGRISPRADLAGLRAPAPHDLDVVMRNTKDMPWVRFPHRAHSLWLDCASCHSAGFDRKADAAPVTMESIFRGKDCGVCHGKVAFPAWHQCERCHSVARPGEGALYGGDMPTSR
jgi:c(7)-type cytochrome triheme protein